MVINKLKLILTICFLFVTVPLLVYGAEDEAVKCNTVFVQDSVGNNVIYTSSGTYRGVAQITAQKNSKVFLALAVFEADTHDLKDITYETKEVTAGDTSLYTEYLTCDETHYLRFFIWQENLEPICQDYIFSPKNQFGTIDLATLTVNGKTYNGFVNPDEKTVMFDVVGLSSEKLSEAKLSFNTNDTVFPDTKENTFDISQELPFAVYGSNGEPVIYTVSAFNSEIRRIYDCQGAKIYTSDEAASLWGGACRAGAPGWVKGETAGGGAWFIEPGGSESGAITIKTEGTNDYLCVNKTTPDNDFILWSGDNKVTPIINKIHASVSFMAEKPEKSDSAFASFDVGATDKIYLTASDKGNYSIGYKDADGNVKALAYSPSLEYGKWYKLDFIFVRNLDISTTSHGKYNGYGVYAYLNGEYIGKTQGISSYPAQYTGYITMNGFSDSTYSVFRLSLLDGSITEFSIDDICVTATYGKDSTESSKCAFDQRLFLASYYAGKNK